MRASQSLAARHRSWRPVSPRLGLWPTTRLLGPDLEARNFEVGQGLRGLRCEQIVIETSRKRRLARASAKVSSLGGQPGQV